MLTNYLKIAWRNLRKYPLFSGINLFGLTSGMAVCLPAMMPIKDAFEYDPISASRRALLRQRLLVGGPTAWNGLIGYAAMRLAGYGRERGCGRQRSGPFHKVNRLWVPLR